MTDQLDTTVPVEDFPEILECRGCHRMITVKGRTGRCPDCAASYHLLGKLPNGMFAVEWQYEE